MVETIRIYLPARPPSHRIIEEFGNKHFYFTDHPEEQGSREIRKVPHEIRVYSSRNLKKVKQLLEEMDEEYERKVGWRKIQEKFDLVAEHITNRRYNVPYPDDSEGCHEWRTLTTEQMKRIIDEAAPYTFGMDRVNLYAALSSRPADRHLGERIAKRKARELRPKMDACQQTIDNMFRDLMAIPTKNPEDTPSTPRTQKGSFLSRAWRKIFAA